MSDQPAADFDPLRQLRIAWRGRWWIALGSLVGLAIGAAITLTVPPRYEATTLLAVRSTTGVVEQVLGTPGGAGATTPALTVAELMRAARVEQAVAAELGVEPDVEIGAVGETNLVAVTGTADTAEGAAEQSTTYVEVFLQLQRDSREERLEQAAAILVTQIAELETGADPADATVASRIETLRGELLEIELASQFAGAGVDVEAAAAPPQEPAGIGTATALALSLVGGAFFTALVVVGILPRRGRVRHAADLEELVGAIPVVAEVVRDGAGMPAAEGVRALAANAAVGPSVRRLLLTGVRGSGDAARVRDAVAALLRARGHHVEVVVGTDDGIPTRALSGPVDPTDGRPPAPSVVVASATPVLRSPQALETLPLVDAVLLVVTADDDRRGEVRDAVRQLRNAADAPVGVVLATRRATGIVTSRL